MIAKRAMSAAATTLATGLAIGLAIGLAAGCSSSTVVEPDPVPGDYTSWFRLDTTGEVPGHGDTYRIIYVNDSGTAFVGAGEYGNGTVIVKEVHDLDGDQPGDLQYIAVMRKLTTAPDGGELQGITQDDGSGWLFTYLADGIDSDEQNDLSCYDTCHRAAPIDHTFFDYGQ